MQKLIDECFETIHKFKSPGLIPRQERKDIRAKLTFGILLELMSMFDPKIVVPNVFKYWADRGNMALCPCSIMVKRCIDVNSHANHEHNKVEVLLTQLALLSPYDLAERLLEIDFRYLGDVSQRSPLIGSWEE